MTQGQSQIFEFSHPFVIVRFEVFDCEIQVTVPLLQINMLPFYRLQKWGWGQLYAGMDGDGDDLEISCGHRGGDGDDEYRGRSGMGINICPRAALY